MEKTGNQIGQQQNKPDFIRLLKAKSVAYSAVDFWQNIEILIVLILMFMPSIQFFFPNWYPLNYILFGIGVATFGLSFVLDNARKKYAKTGALIQQKFDNDLFNLELDVQISEEEISKLEQKFKKNTENLSGWYSPMITPDVNTNSAILLCQRSSIYWTIGLRKILVKLFVWVGLVYYIIILAAGCVAGLTLCAFLLSFIAPSLMMLKFILGSYLKQTEIVNSCEIGLGKADMMLNRYLTDGIAPTNEELIAIQKMVFEIRKKPQVIYNMLYTKKIKQFENITNEAAKRYVKKILEKQKANQ